MPIETSCVAVARPSGDDRQWTRVCRAVAGAAVLVLAACAQSGPGVPGSKPPVAAQSFDDGVDSLTAALLAGAQRDPADHATRRILVVDPLIDRGTGNQVVATRRMADRMIARVREQTPSIEPRPFTAENLDQKPLLLVGSITAVAGPGSVPPVTSRRPTVYRIWASLSDLRTGKIIAKEMAWVRADGVDMSPTEFFRASPAWAADPAMVAYLKTCGGNPGEPVDPTYLNGVKANAATAEGIQAYENGRPLEALVALTAAEHLAGGDQIRVHNGLYLTNLALGRTDVAEAEFGRMIDAGLDQGKLAVKLVFKPASVQFWPERAISGPYPMWLRQIAAHAAERSACLRIIGHTSPTGAPEINDVLSKRRAEFVRATLIRRAPQLRPRTQALGRGSSEPIVGSGRDDATDVLDRRVEFAPSNCVRTGL